MNKQQFITKLRERLSGLPQEDTDRFAEYYSEMIDDRMEDGMTEEESVAALGSINNIVTEILKDTSVAKLVREKVRSKRRLRTWEIVLLVLGSPLWFPLGLMAMCIVAAAYIVIWAAVVVLYCANLCVAACSISAIFCTVVFALTAKYPEAIMFFGAGLILAGLSILMLLGVNMIAKGVAILSKKILMGVKSCFVRKGEE